MRWQSPAQSSWRFALFQASWFPRFPLTPPAKVTRTFDSSNPKLQEEKLYSNGGGAALEGTGWGGAILRPQLVLGTIHPLSVLCPAPQNTRAQRAQGACLGHHGDLSPALTPNPVLLPTHSKRKRGGHGERRRLGQVGT